MKFLIILNLLPWLVFSQTKESWITKPKTQWPQIALVNDVLYKNGDKSQDPTVTYAGTGFLVDTGNDTLAVTVKHVLYAARNKATNKVYINDHLKKWKMFPKDNPADSVIIERLINEDTTESLWDDENGVLQRDWIVFTTRYRSPNIQPLRIRKEPVKGWQKLHLIGNPYRFKNTLIASGELLRKEGNHLLVHFPVMDTTILGGASGSPIVDNNGHLVGIFSNSRNHPTIRKGIAIVNSTEYLMKILNGTKPLNMNKKSVSKFFDSLMSTHPVKISLNKFDSLIKNPDSHNVYEQTYINRGSLITTGDGLLSDKRTQDAIEYFSYFEKLFPETYPFGFGLAKAYHQNNERQKAIETVENTLTKVFDEDKAEVLKFLEELKKYQ